MSCEGEGVTLDNSNRICVVSLVCSFSLVLVNLAIIDYHQTKTEAAILDSTSNTDNKFVCRVQFGSTLDRDSEPMVTWYLNGVPVSDLPGPFNRPSKPSIMPVDDLNKTATSTLTITGGRMQDTGVYECRFNWKGETASHNFTFTIFGRYSAVC